MIPTATTTTKVAINRGLSTRRSRISSGRLSATTAIMKASRVPIGRPLSCRASTNGRTPAALEYSGSPISTARATARAWPLAVLAGVPLSSNAAGVLPLVEALHDKGLPMGTLLAFMMGVVALSLPELILLRRVLKPRLIATFVVVVVVGIIAVGYLFNALL